MIVENKSGQKRRLAITTLMPSESLGQFFIRLSSAYLVITVSAVPAILVGAKSQDVQSPV